MASKGFANKNQIATILHSCEICGQDGLREDELRQHLKSVHIDGAVQCPFCDLASNEVTPNQMTLHVNSAHLEYLTPEREFGGGFSEFEEDFDSIWQLERQAKEGLTNGLGDSPTDDIKSPPKEMNKRARGSDSIDSPMSTCTEASEATDNSNRYGEGSSSSVTSSPGPRAAALSGGAIQKRIRSSIGGSNSSPSRSSLTLDVKPHRMTAPLESPTSVADDLECPLCQFKDSDPIRLQDHVNRSHFDPNSPEDSKTAADNSVDTLPSCPICQQCYTSVIELERHVNIDHGDILSPEDKKDLNSVLGSTNKTTSQQLPSTPDSNGNQACPVCNKTGFENQNELVDHIDQHFAASDAETKATPPPAKKKGRSFKLTNRASSFNFPFASMSTSSTSSNSSSRSSVMSTNSKSDANDQLQNDFLLAQEIARREQEKRKYEEQKEFDQLRAQFGMDNEGNYRQQSLSNMQKAVYKGELSVVDYYERQVDLKQSEQSGVDEGHSVTRNLIPRLRLLCQQTGGVAQVYLCSTVDHHASSFGDKGWGCGYRNLQMLLSSLQCHSSFSECLKPVLGGGPPSIPSISKLQDLIEEAWSAGFDVQGRDQLGGQLKNTRKWIGATEIVAFLTSRRIQSELIDFHMPSARDGAHPRLFQWVLNYFRERALNKKFAPPLYLQHQGHSRTIVGVEVVTSGNETLPRLLIFDPSHSRSHMTALMAGGKNDNATATTLRMLRKTSATIRCKQYQIVAVTGIFANERELSNHKVIHSKRIP